MKVSPVASPHAMSPQQGNHNSTQEARDRAISRLMGGNTPSSTQPQQPVVPNQNAVSPEEVSAMREPAKIDSGSPNETTAEATQEAVTTEETSSPTEEAAPKKTPEDPAISRQFAQLARQEKAIRVREAAIKAKEAAMSAKEAELTGKPSTPDLSNYIDKGRLTSDTLSVLAEAGISYDTLTQQLINQQPTDPRVLSTIQKLEARLAEQDKKLLSYEKTQQDSQKNAYDTAVKQIKMDASRTIDRNPEFETIKVTGSVDDVVELITQTFEKDGILLSVEEACQTVEDYLVEEATKLANITKIKQRLQASQASKETPKQAVQQTPAPNAPKQQQPMKTLTNATSSTRQLSARERAILAAEGKLVKS